MTGHYLGRLSPGDPLFGYLRREIFPQLGCDCRDGIRVFGTNGSNAVYIYEDRASDRKVVGKFFRSRIHPDWEGSLCCLDREYRGIREFRRYRDSCHYVARILGRNDELDRLLVVEYCSGEPLDSIIMRAIGEHDDGLLYGKLTALAYFLATMHNRSACPRKVDFRAACRYFDAVLAGASPLMTENEFRRFAAHRESWAEYPPMWQDQEVLTHGDATPSNFLFGEGLHVTAFDLERSHRADRVFDTGRVAGELKHFFLRATGNKYASEPFIGHFLWEYACHFPDRDRAFRSICERVPFYLAATLLRIARNGYLDREYRRLLIEEAELALRRQTP